METKHYCNRGSGMDKDNLCNTCTHHAHIVPQCQFSDIICEYEHSTKPSDSSVCGDYSKIQEDVSTWM